MSVGGCVDEVLDRGLDDWIQAAEVASIALTTGGARNAKEARDLSLQVVGMILGGGLMRAGMVFKEKGFVPWDLSPERALRKIEIEWRSLPGGPGLGEIFWLDLTKKGDARARSLRHRRDG